MAFCWYWPSFHMLICHLSVSFLCFNICYGFCSFYNSFFFLLSFDNSSYTLDTRLLLDMLFAHIFSGSSLYFHPLRSLSQCKMFYFWWTESIYFFFILWRMLLMSYLRTLCLTLGLKDFLLFFLTVLLKGHFPPLHWFLYFCQKPVGYICIDLFLDSLPLICVAIPLPIVLSGWLQVYRKP